MSTIYTLIMLSLKNLTIQLTIYVLSGSDKVSPNTVGFFSDTSDAFQVQHTCDSLALYVLTSKMIHANV